MNKTTNRKFNKNLLTKPKQKKNLTLVLLGLYFCILFFGVWTSLRINNGQIEIDWEIYELPKSINLAFNYSIKDFSINFIMLVPLGLYFVQFKLNLTKAWCLGLMVGCIIEIGQFVLPINRVVQLMDALTNGLSSVLGCTIAENMSKPLKKINYYDKITK